MATPGPRWSDGTTRLCEQRPTCEVEQGSGGILREGRPPGRPIIALARLLQQRHPERQHSAGQLQVLLLHEGQHLRQHPGLPSQATPGSRCRAACLRWNTGRVVVVAERRHRITSLACTHFNASNAHHQ